MASSLKEKNKELFELLTEFYEGLGMKADLKHATFSDDTRKVYWYPYHETSDKIIYQPMITLRFPEIQRIQDSLLPKKANLTINRFLKISLAEELKVHQHKYIPNETPLIEDDIIYYKISNEASTVVDKLIDDHKLYMQEIGLNLFLKMDTIEKVHRFINNELLSYSSTQRTGDQSILLRKKSGNQEVIAGLIASFLISQNTGQQVYQARLELYEKNVRLKKELSVIFNHFQSS